MAEEDLIFGKNRHFFGGIEPSNMLEFRVVVEGDVVKVTAGLPNDTVVDSQTLCTVEGAIIRRKTTDYPKDEFDGDLVANIKESTVFTDSGASPTETYYYAAFPYTTQGVYNRNKANRTTTKMRGFEYLYGYDLAVATADPSDRVTYPYNVDNAGFTPAAMNFSSGVFDYGSWNIEPGTKFMPRPCMLTYAGVVDHYLNPDDYTKKTDGSASSVSDQSFGGNAMMEWPKIWTKRWEENGVYHFRCSDVQIDEDYECWCNYDRNNNQIDHFYTPIYFGSVISDRMRSISSLSNTVNLNASGEISYAEVNGDGWYTEVLADRLLIQDLLVMMAKSTDGQTAYGSGRSKSSAMHSINQGTMDTKGMFWGSNDRDSGVKVFGMEHLWGNLLRRTAGWINENGTQKVKLTRGTHDGSTATDYNTDGSGYLSVPGATFSSTTNGYINAMVTMPYGRIPYDASGSATTFEADTAHVYVTDSQINYAVFSGTYGSDLQCGPFHVWLNLSTNPRTDTGAALSCKPLATA